MKLAIISRRYLENAIGSVAGCFTRITASGIAGKDASDKGSMPVPAPERVKALESSPMCLGSAMSNLLDILEQALSATSSSVRVALLATGGLASNCFAS
ncbi:uncharacterized protein N7458_005209 [Penicillium daleae]|uniref:Uncharacterized protein n=1 Tax=Penicillium daleae TaxID=63821 RepID=A0AAD6G3M4_9EURO|nr:uncharacterized protein N7458_005209 [Penicillium daleae]KAJ5454253.1 hypothetical protein N7458_005209 [Penicillium daleae]